MYVVLSDCVGCFIGNSQAIIGGGGRKKEGATSLSPSRE